METKTCCRCNEVKPLTDYYKHGGACKVCTCKRIRERYPFRPPEQVEAKRQRGKAYKINNRDRVNERAREDNKKPHIKAWRKEYLEKNRVFLREQYREYYKNNRSAIVEYKKNWLHQNPEKWSQYYEAYIAKPEKREATVARAQRDREELRLGYIKTLFKGGKLERIPVELIEAKRTQIQIRRAIQDMTP